MRSSTLGRAAAATGIVVTVLMVLMKVLPQAPGHFNAYEWVALAGWILLGVVLRRSAKTSEADFQPDLG